MKKSNWKAKVLVGSAFLAGAAAAGAVAVFLPEKYELYKGLMSFGALAVVSVTIVFIGVKILRIGEE